MRRMVLALALMLTAMPVLAQSSVGELRFIGPAARARFFEVTCSGATSGQSILCASSSAHELQLSNNGGSFSGIFTKAGGTLTGALALPSNGLNVGSGQLQVTSGNVSATGSYFESGRAVALGYWSGVTYASGNFAADSPGTWTVDSGDQATYAYVVIGKTVVVSFTLLGTTVSGSPLALRLAIPAGFTAARQMEGVYEYSDNGAALSTGTAVAIFSAGYIGLYKASGTWGNATNTTDVRGTIIFQVN